MVWWYLSFTDATRPKGRQWLGAAYVEAEGFIEAVDRAHFLEINPGGEVRSFGPLDQATMDANTPPEDRERLLGPDWAEREDMVTFDEVEAEWA